MSVFGASAFGREVAIKPNVGATGKEDDVEQYIASVERDRNAMRQIMRSCTEDNIICKKKSGECAEQTASLKQTVSKLESKLRILEKDLATKQMLPKQTAAASSDGYNSARTPASRR
jgi:hypothetical protein